VFTVVGETGENFSGTRQRRPQANFFNRGGGSVFGKLVERRAQRLEVVDNALHSELWRVAFADGRGDIDDAAFGKQAGQNLAAGRRHLKKNKFHGSPPKPFCVSPSNLRK